MPYRDPEKQREYWRTYQRSEKSREYKRKWTAENRAKLRDQQRSRYASDPEKYRQYFRNHRMRKKYDLTERQYSELVVQQSGRCAICGSEPRGHFRGDRMLNVDHCHTTGKIRGLLCNRCNRALGLVGDTVEAVSRMLEYLRNFEGSK